MRKKIAEPPNRGENACGTAGNKFLDLRAVGLEAELGAAV